MKSAGLKNLFKNRIAVSAVISNLILIAAVITVGFAALAWTYATSSSFTTQYSNTVNSDINALKERIAFEFVFYDNNTKSTYAYILNCGTIDTVNATIIYISNASTYCSFSTGKFQLRYLNRSLTTCLNKGEEGYFVMDCTQTDSTPINLQTSTSYTMKIVTGRGSSFVYTFVA